MYWLSEFCACLQINQLEHSSLLGIWMYVLYACMRVCVFACEGIYGAVRGWHWVSSWLFINLSAKAASLTEHELADSTKLTNQPASVSWGLGLQVGCHAIPGCSVGAGSLSPCSHTFLASALSIEPSLQSGTSNSPWNLIIKCSFLHILSVEVSLMKQRWLGWLNMAVSPSTEILGLATIFANQNFPKQIS